MRRLLFGVVMSVGCSWHVPGLAPGADPGSEDTPAPVADAGGVGGSGAVDGGAASGDDAGTPGPVASCYSEDYSPGVSLVDLAASFSPQQWKAMSLTALLRRIPGGHALLDTMQDDPQLPNFVDASSWGALMQSLLTMCHEETHGYDYGHADASDFLFYLRPDLLLAAPQLATFPRSEILAYINDDATATYDQTFLMGEQGTYDLVSLAEELTAYTNGLSCIAAVADQIQSGISARDGVAASLYYLELYLRRARTAHPTVYANLQASPEWQKLVRYSWARGLFWRAAGAASQLAIADAPIWAHVDDPANSGEIERFTGSKVSDIACRP